jgi:hypothetical protein
MTDTTLQVSIVVVDSERPQPFAEFYEEFAEPLRQAGITYEFIFVVPADDGALLVPLIPLRDRGEPIQIFEAAQPVGEAGLLRSVVQYARGRTILVLAAYRRVAAEALPLLLRAIDDGADLAVARRSAANDRAGNQLQRRLSHFLVRFLVGGSFHDLGSGVRAIRRDVLDFLPWYGEFSRFLPLFALREGMRVREIDVPQHPADRATQFYSPGTYIRRLIDLLAVFFLIRFREKPLRFFGFIGGLVSLAGTVTLGILGIQRIMGEPLADRPMLLVAVLLVVLGVQGIALGLIGEIIVHASAKRRIVYRVAPPKTK